MIILADGAPEISQGLIVAGLSLMAGLGLTIFFIVALVKACGTKTKGWIIACAMSAILAVGAVGVAGRYGVAEVQRLIAEGDKIEQPMTGKSGRFTLTVPKSWTSMPELNTVGDLGAGNLLREQYLMLIAESKQEAGLELEAFAKVVTEQMQETMSNATLGAFEKLSVGGFPALRCRLAGKVDGIDIVYQHTSIDTGDSLCQILCWTLPSRERMAFPLFDKVAATFAVIGEPSAKKPPQGSPEERVRQIVVDQLGVAAAKVTAAARLKEDLEADDLDNVELVMAVEEEFGISIPDEEAEKWQTVGDMVRTASSQNR